MKMTLNNPDEIKIFILFLLEGLGMPMSFSDLGTVVIRDGVVDYFSYFEYFSDLVEDGHVVPVGPDGKTPLYEVVASEERQPGANFEQLKAEADTRQPKFPRPTSEDIGNPRKRYTVTATGRAIARSLSQNMLMAAIREKSYESAMRHLSLEREGISCDQSFDRDGDGFIFHCKISDTDGVALDLSLRAETVYRLNRMRTTFDERPDVILRGITSLLTGNVNYLFEE